MILSFGKIYIIGVNFFIFFIIILNGSIYKVFIDNVDVKEIVKFNLDFIEYLDFSNFFECINEVIVFLVFLLIFSDVESSEVEDDSSSFMEEFVRLSRK